MNLTQTASLTKRLLLFLAILVVVGFSSWIGYRYYYYNIYLPSKPPPEEKPDVKFGKLPKPLLPEGGVTATNFQYALDTPTGELPGNLPKLMKVFFVPQRSITLLDPDRSESLAKSLLFPLGPEIITPTQFKFTDEEGGELSIDLNSGNFKFVRNINFESSPSAQVGTLASATKLEEDLKAYLSSKGLTKPQLQKGRTRAIYDKKLLKDSTTATVSIWPNDLGEYKIVTPLYNAALVRQVVRSGSKEIDKILSLNYVYWEIDEETFATYPIKSAIVAYEDLKQDRGVVVLAPASPQVSLREVYLAYYQSEEYVPYIQPIYVFEGENFVAYVPAIPSDYLE